MHALTYMDDPRSELESMLSSSIDAELPLALERNFWFGLPNWLPNSDASANVSVYIFALACFHLVFLVLVGGWGVSFLVIRSDKIRSDLVRSGQIRSGQTRSDQGRSGQGWSLCYVWDDHGVEILISSRWGNIENPYSYVVEDCVIVLT